MKDILNAIDEWESAGKEFCIATVTNTWRSSPRPVGSSMLIARDGEMAGSVSGGCVEKSVVEASKRVFENNAPLVLNYGVEDEDAWNVGLSCGGRIEVLVEKFPLFLSDEESKLWKRLKKAWSDKRPIAFVAKLDGGESHHFLIEPGNTGNESIINEALVLLNSGRSEKIVTPDGNYFVQSFLAPKRLIMIGSAHITSELLQLAVIHDFETIVIDPRNTFATKTHHIVKPGQLFINWPQEILPNLHPDKDTFAVILSHDPKIDDAALEILLKLDVPYIGALGSKKTHEKRKARLKAKGYTEEEINRIKGPIGLDIGAMTAKEIALSIMAQIVAVKNRQSD